MKPTNDTRKPYVGQRRSLVLALDIGTTFSGVSYAILEPGEVPKIHGVTRFPGQEHVAGNSKIPSIMYYDQDGKMKATGAEADGAAVLAQAEDEGWIKTELFKLRLRPKSMTLKMNGMRLSPLPRNKTAVDVFGDFLSYLFRCTHSFIVDTHANGHALWRAVEHDIQFVLSHPNGWEGAQQTKMRRAAVMGGLIPDTDEGKARIRFVTEGEASLHACVLNGLAADVLSNPSGHGFIVADAGGGTLDISSYAIRGTAPLVIEEIAPPDCVFAGSVFVSRRARKFFEEKLKNSKYGSPDSLDHIAKRFDETTKRLFRDKKELQFVPFGSPLDKDLTVGIRGGQLKLTGEEVAALFEPSIEAAIASIRAQMTASSSTVKSVWLVGGFAASPWLFTQLQERLKPLGVTVSRPDSQTSKAVADGAIGFYCDHHVAARMSKFMYGVEYLRDYDANDAEHVSRQHRLFEMPSGPKLLPDAFDCILARGVRVKESTVFTRKYCTEVTSLSTLSVFEVEIWCYRGGNEIPKWILREHEHFSTLCYVRADLSPLASSAQSQEGKNGKTYWKIVFSIEIHFGLTEFKARMKWVDNGHVKYGPASIVYNEMGHRAAEEEEDLAPDDDSAYTRSNYPPSVASSRAPSIPSTPSLDPVGIRSRSISRPASVAHSPLPAPVELQPAISRAPSIVQTSARHSIISNTSNRSSEHERRPSRHLSRQPESTQSRRASTTFERAPGTPTPRAPEVMDRSINFSARSTDSRVSVRTSATARLGENLNAIWGTPSSSSSQQQTPVVSPTGEAASYFEAATSLVGLDHVPVASNPATPPVTSTPPAISKPATPAVISRALTPPETSKPASPPVASKPPISGAATPQVVAEKVLSSKVTSKAPSKVATPVTSPKASTPTAVSKVSTPKATTPTVGSKVSTPVATPKFSTPGATTPKPSASNNAAPAVLSRAVSLAGSSSPPLPPVLESAASASPKATSPKETSRAPSKAVSRASTPKVATPKIISRSASPKLGSPSLPEPPKEEPPVALSKTDVDEPQPPLTSQIDSVLERSEAIPGAFDDWTKLENPGHSSSGDFGGEEHKPGDIVDLWNTDNKVDADQGLSELLTHGPQWKSGTSSGTASKRLSAFGGARGLGTNLVSTLGSGLFSLGAKAAGAGGSGLSNALGFGSFQDNGPPNSTEKAKTPEPEDNPVPEIPHAATESPPADSGVVPPETQPEPSVLAAPAALVTWGGEGTNEKDKNRTSSHFDAAEPAGIEATTKAEADAAAAKAAEEESAQKAADEASQETEADAAAAAAKRAEEEAATAKKAEEDAAAAQKAEEDAVGEATRKAEMEAAAQKSEEEAAAEAAKKAEEEAAAAKEETGTRKAEQETGTEERTTEAKEGVVNVAETASGTEVAGTAVDTHETHDTETAADLGEDGEDAGDGPDPPNEDQPPKETEQPDIDTKKKKGKKGGGSSAATAENMSRTTSAQGGGNQGGGKGKKGKKKR